MTRCHVRRQGVRVDSGDEDRMRARRRIDHPAVRPGSQCGPLARFEQQVAHLPLGHPARVTAGKGMETDCLRLAAFPLGPALLDDHRLQRAPGAPVNSPDRARRRGGVAHPRHRLVLEQKLAASDRVTYRDVHGRPEADVVGGHERDVPNRGGVFDHVGRHAGNRQSQTACDGMARHLWGGQESLCSAHRRDTVESISRGPPGIRASMALLPTPVSDLEARRDHHVRVCRRRGVRPLVAPTRVHAGIPRASPRVRVRDSRGGSPFHHALLPSSHSTCRRRRGSGRPQRMALVQTHQRGLRKGSPTSIASMTLRYSFSPYTRWRRADGCPLPELTHKDSLGSSRGTSCSWL